MDQVSQSPISIVVIDDHPLIRESLAMLLNGHEKFNVLSSFENATTGLKAVEDLAPDVVLIDISMPGPCPFDGVRQLKESGIKSRFIFLSAYLTDSYLRDVLKSQASGYVIKTTPLHSLIGAISSVNSGSTYFSPEVQERMARFGRPIEGKEQKTRADTLTPREIEVLRYVARGLSVKQVAQALHLSSRTVDRHKANIMHKLKIHNQAGLVRYALAEGLSDSSTFLEPGAAKIHA